MHLKESIPRPIGVENLTLMAKMVEIIVSMTMQFNLISVKISGTFSLIVSHARICECMVRGDQPTAVKKKFLSRPCVVVD